MSEHFVIYKTTCLVNNKIYIGKHKTKNINDDYLGSGVLLKKAIEKHGKDNFVREILFFCKDEKELNLVESKIIDENFVSRPDVYNLALGGQGGASVASFISDEKRKDMTSKMVKTKSGRTKEDWEYLQRASDKHKGRNKYNTEYHANAAVRMTGQTKENNERVRNHSDIMKKIMSEKEHPSAKQCILKNPQDEIIEITDLAKFCKANDLAYSILRYKGQQKDTLAITKGKSMGWSVISYNSKN